MGQAELCHNTVHLCQTKLIISHKETPLYHLAYTNCFPDNKVIGQTLEVLDNRHNGDVAPDVGPTLAERHQTTERPMLDHRWLDIIGPSLKHWTEMAETEVGSTFVHQRCAIWVAMIVFYTCFNVLL